jgi:hypothetical protein
MSFSVNVALAQQHGASRGNQSDRETGFCNPGTFDNRASIRCVASDLSPATLRDQVDRELSKEMSKNKKDRLIQAFIDNVDLSELKARNELRDGNRRFPESALKVYRINLERHLSSAEFKDQVKTQLEMLLREDSATQRRLSESLRRAGGPRNNFGLETHPLVIIAIENQLKESARNYPDKLERTLARLRNEKRTLAMHPLSDIDVLTTDPTRLQILIGP